MKKVLSILLVVCLALAIPAMALAEGGVTITDKTYTWNKLKVTKPVFGGPVAKVMNEIIDETYLEAQRVAQRAGVTGTAISYEVHYQDANLISMSVHNDISGDTMASDIFQPYYILFDLTTGKALHYGDLFADGWEERFLAEVNEMTFYPSVEGIDWDREYCEAIGIVPPFDAFFIDGDEMWLTFVYPAGSVQPEELGVQRFSMYFTTLAGYIGADSPIFPLVPEIVPVPVEEPAPVEEPVVRFGIIGGIR